MSRTRAWGALLLVLTIAAGCHDETLVPQTAPPPSPAAAIGLDPETIARALVSQSNWPLEGDTAALDKPLDPGIASLVQNWQREVVYGDIVHYSCLVRVGTGPYDVMGLHRVVKERHLGVPIKTHKNIFLQHGDAVPFTPKWLFGCTSPNVPDEQSAAVFWAQNGVDVWGIDQPWMLVPIEETDFAFMAPWGIQHSVDNLRLGLGIARWARALTGSGFDPLLLLGYSSGVYTGFACLNQESQLPPALRHVKGYIAADGPFKTATPEIAAPWCEIAAMYKSWYEAGTYQNAEVLGFLYMIDLARTGPEEPSPVVPGLTNLQAFLLLSSASYNFPPVYVPWYHYFAGTFDASGVPTGLQYTTVPASLDFFGAAAPYGATLFAYEYSMCSCGEADLPFDDHLGEIRVPVFYVGNAGGFGDTGLHVTTLLGSSDITTLIVRLHPASEVTLDFGHVDLWAAGNAQDLAWEPMLRWIVGHSARGGKGNDAMHP